ncbi:hypothetical protein CHU98_g11786 [Xylaria longipes]|nr:hypothetical protein CHU98_g11786 [Xylaria longipes]
MAGQEKLARESESLILDDERFTFGNVDVEQESFVDFIYSEEAARAGHLKIVAHQELVGQWLHNRAGTASPRPPSRAAKDVPSAPMDFAGSNS